MPARQKTLLLELLARRPTPAGRQYVGYSGLADAAAHASTEERYGIGPLPPKGPARMRYLADPAHWQAERRQLHTRLLIQTMSKGMGFAEALREHAEIEPTLFAMRGNTAAGKTRTAVSAIPVLLEALQKSNGGMINPDLFKDQLRRHGGGKWRSAQVHAESCMLADRLEQSLAESTTADGAPVSMLVDKRLAPAAEVIHYATMARRSARKMELHDIDAPLERSLAGVLERDPAGAHPIPPYHVVSEGFAAIRGHRSAVIDTFVQQPQIGAYRLYGATVDGGKMRVARVDHGTLQIDAPDLFQELISPPGPVSEQAGERIIDGNLIQELTRDLAPHRALQVRAALEAYWGLSWREAVDAHSRKD